MKAIFYSLHQYISILSQTLVFIELPIFFVVKSCNLKLVATFWDDLMTLSFDLGKSP